MGKKKSEIEYCPKIPNEKDCKGCYDWREGEYGWVCMKVSWNKN